MAGKEGREGRQRKGRRGEERGGEEGGEQREEAERKRAVKRVGSRRGAVKTSLALRAPSETSYSPFARYSARSSGRAAAVSRQSSRSIAASHAGLALYSHRFPSGFSVAPIRHGCA